MKTLIILLILLTAGMAWATTWEGELDPNEFSKWKFLSVTPNVEGLAWVLIKNPDHASSIDIVALAVDLSSNILGYRYFKYGEPYSYTFDNNQDKYVRHYFTHEEKESCMKCHSGELIPAVSI